MRRLSHTRRAAVAIAAALLSAPQVASADADLSDQIVVRHRASATAGERAEVRRDAGVTLDEKLRLTGVELVETDGSRAAALAELRDDPDVLWAEPNLPVHLATDDPFWSVQYGLENLGAGGGTADADVDAPEAWTVSRGSGITVGVVDSGVDSTHPDLAGQLQPSVNFVPGQTTTDDGHGHGTHVAGIIAALSGNQIGVTGAAPLAKVQALRALDATGSGSTVTVASAFDYAGDNGLRVVNASLGSTAPTLVERQAIQEHPNTLFVVAAGNSALNIDSGGTTAYPCRYTEANVLCVGASTATDGPASFSNRGTTSVDLFAPGDSIASTYPVNKGSYVYMSGTSMASPLVAAAAALVVSANPTFTAAQVKSALLETVDHPAALAGVSVTGGRLNAARALGVAVGPDGQAPSQLAGLVAAPGLGRVDLTWSASAASDLADYRVWRLDGATWTPVTTVTSPLASITGLTAGESVTVRVTARDRSGEESTPSATATAVSLATVPTTPPPTTPAPTTPAPTTPASPTGTTPAPTTPLPADPTPVIADPAPGDHQPAPLPVLPDLGVVGSSATPAPTSNAPAGVTPATLSRMSGLRVAKVNGRARGLRFQLSAAGPVTVVATRRKTASQRALTRTRKLTLAAGPQYLSFRPSAHGLGLAKGTWRVNLQAQSGKGTLTFTVR